MPTRPGTVAVNITLSVKDARELMDYCREEGVNRAEFIRAALGNEFARRRDPLHDSPVDGRTVTSWPLIVTRVIRMFEAYMECSAGRGEIAPLEYEMAVCAREILIGRDMAGALLDPAGVNRIRVQAAGDVRRSRSERDDTPVISEPRGLEEATGNNARVPAPRPKPRRLRASEERLLLSLAKQLARAEEAVESSRRDRDEALSDLIDDGARIVDIADVLGLTRAAINDARRRIRQVEDPDA